MADRSTANDVEGGWLRFVALGAGLLALSIVAWIDAVAVTVASAIVIGGTLVAAGVFHLLNSLAGGHWRGSALSLCSGVLYAIGGLLTMREPAHGAAVLTLLLTMTIATAGFLRIVSVLRLSYRREGTSPLLLLGGIASVVIGALIYMSLPWPGLWLLGVLIAIELFVQGSGWFYMGFALRAG
jgi:uncharacterized membrane protein HdeD (DUF308 family)